ncbi:MAG TPA: glycosyltransferase family 4 protein [Balneolaceae bacterium]|nr:glycosyltransferase family 4 protein [Balneolaceae bacterium]
MDILFVTISWPGKERHNLYSDLMEKFKENEHEVYVLTNSPRRTGNPTSYTIENNIHVLRVKTGNVSKTNPVEKSLSLLLLEWQLKRGLNRYFNNETFDLILFNTPPITLSKLLRYLKSRYNCPLYLLLKDIWPYGFVNFDLIKRDGLIYKYFRRHEERLYKLADVIGCMSPKGVEFILEKHPYLPRDKVEVCPNSIKVRENRLAKNNAIRSKYGIPEEATVFIFSGNLGLGHGLDFLIRAIIKLKEYDKAFFLIGGAGTYYSKIKTVFERENPANAYLYSYLPAEEYEALISTCNVGLILLDSHYTYPQFPSRLLSYLENKMAVLCTVNEETDIGEIVEDNEAGLNTIHGDMNAFVEAVKEMSENKKHTTEMGIRGFNLLKNQYDVTKSYEVIMKHFV